MLALSYRAAATIVESLDSFKAQTYRRIELILCDDGSTDGTVGLAEEWLARHADRFERVEFVRHPVNQGIVRNHASGLERCRGEWIKIIACDDLLMPEALAKFVERARATNSGWLVSQCRKFSEDNGIQHDLGDLTKPLHTAVLARGQLPELHTSILMFNILPAPGAFVSRRLIESIGGIDLRFLHLDDWPMWARLLDAGHIPNWIAEPLVRYRITAATVSQRTAKMAVSPLLFEDERLFRKLYQSKQLSRMAYWHVHIHEWRKAIVMRHFGNRAAILPWTAIALIISPIAWNKMAAHLWNQGRNRGA